MDILVGHLRLVVYVEGQRIVVLPEPGVSVAEIPECHAVDDVLVLTEHAEHTGVLVGQVLLQRVIDGSTVTAEGQLTAHLLIGADVKFGDVDVVDHLFI